MARLPSDAVEFIKKAHLSYSQILEEINQKWKRKTSKGLVSYYPGSRNGRFKPLSRVCIMAHEWDWLVGLYYADGSKFVDKYHHVVAFTLDSLETETKEKLCSILEKMDLRVRVLALTNKRVFDIRVCNKGLYSMLPAKKEIYNPSVDLAFLAGLMDGDGHIKKHSKSMKWVFTQAQTKYPHLAKQVAEISGKYGRVTTRLYQRKNNKIGSPVYRVFILTDARKALSKTKFVDFCVKYKLLVGRAGLS